MNAMGMPLPSWNPQPNPRRTWRELLSRLWHWARGKSREAEFAHAYRRKNEKDKESDVRD
jgi:hypothetical protein